MNDWLTDEEQFQEILNNEQISRIKDPVLREIRERHWEYRTGIFLDESNITDEELDRLIDRDIREEEKELNQYKINKVNLRR